MSKWKRMADYAKECGVSQEAIRQRIKNEHIELVYFPQPDGGSIPYIDIDKFPPFKMKPGPRKNKNNK